MIMHGNGKSTVAVLGLGAMGTALAEALSAAGNDVRVWNRTSQRAAAAVAAGARQAGSSAEAVEDAALVVVCVSDAAAVRAILEPLAEHLGGRTVVNLTSGSSKEGRALAAVVDGFGAQYLDGAVMAAPADLGGPETLILLSGSATAYREHQSTLEGIAGRATYLGPDAGLSSLHDVAVLAIMWSVLNGFLHGAALLKRSGVEAADFLPIAQNGINTTAGWLAGYAAQVDADDHPGHDSTMTTHVAAMQHLVEETVATGVDPALPLAFKALGDRAVEAGLGERGYTALIELLLSGRP
ncbi:MAG TPA: NAD(P)-binding domain-containing protein [Nocardioides sp.]|nr:NAD(P)-binding domain-containing protein [Nocardioides sp.]